VNPWWTIGWRNLLRNRRRTAITAGALACGYFAVVIMDVLSLGMIADMIDNGTGLLLGQVQVHADDYLPDRSMYATLGGDDGVDVADLLARVESDPAVDAAAPRVYGGGLVSAGEHTGAAVLLGVDPAREVLVTRLLRGLARGRPPADTAREIVLGADLARRLAVGPGMEVVVVAPAADGSLGNDLFRVSGVFDTGIPDLDAGYAVLAVGPLQELLALAPNRIHEIAARERDPWGAPATARRVAERLAGVGPPLAVDPWTTYRPELVDYARLTTASQWIVLAVVFGMAIFGVANTMVMATFERRREFAVLLALGAAPRGIVGSVMAEAVALGALSLVLGLVVTVPVMIWFHLAPPDLGAFVGGFSMAGAFLRPVLRLEYPNAVLVGSAVALFVTAVLAAGLPALRSSRLPPAETLGGR